MTPTLTSKAPRSQSNGSVIGWAAKHGGRALLLYPAAIATLTFLAYSGSFDGQFVSDDVRAIRNNPLIRSLEPANIAEIFRSFDASNYMPVKVLSQAIDYRLWGPEPFGFHLTNLLLHILCALLVYRLLLRLKMPSTAALLTALLWALHPLQVESVAFMDERKNVLSTLFFLWAFLKYLDFSESGRRASYLGLVALFVLALLSKMNTVVLPAVCLAYEAAHRFRLRKRDVLVCLPLLAIGAAVVWYNLAGNRFHGARWHGGSPIVTWLSSSVVVFRYLANTIAPTDLRVFYNVPLRGSPFDTPVALSLLGLIGLVAATVWLLARKRSEAFWILWFGLTLAPMLNIVPFASLMQDRYMYLPLLGPLALLVGTLDRLTRASAARRTLATAAAAVIVACAGLTYQRVEIWSDPISLWRDSALRNWYIATDSGRWRPPDSGQKMAILREAARETPASAVVQNNLGAMLFESGQLSEAIAHLERAEQLSPHEPILLLNLGRAYHRSGDLAKAEATLKRATARDPYSFFAHLNLARVYLAHRDAPAARAELDACARIRPDSASGGQWRGESEWLERLESEAR